jgi:4-hydroxy-tetrahydrodipicolinate reductase
MIKIIVCGAAGKMGTEVIQAVHDCEDITIVAGIEAPGHRLVGNTISSTKIYDDIADVIRDTDCIVDFTNPRATLVNVKKVMTYKKPFVTGTTGFSDADLKDIEQISRTIPIFISPNMSLGVNHLYNLVASSATALPEYDVEIIETHHRAKKDAPSGTAKAIADIIKGIQHNTEFVHGRDGLVGERKPNEVLISSVRGGDVVGEHRVLFFGTGEFLEIRHYATSRKCFARGTLAAVRFMVGKPPGLYSMRDVLKR